MSDPVRNYDHKTIQFRRGTTAEWQKFGSTCIPAEAEICVEFFQNPTGSRNGSVGIKVGNGVSTFNQLPHIVSDEESDPVFTNHPAYQITQDLIDSWNDDAEGISDAPNSKAYSRQKGVWVEAPTLNQVKDLEAKVDAIDPDGGGSVGWDEIEGKPSTFPPSAHNHDGDYLKTETDPTVPAHVKGITQADIDGWNAGGSGGASTWDELTGKPAEFPPESHTHEQSEVDGLELRLDAIEDSITSGGGFVDAPNDGKLYGRQSENWEEVPDGGVSDWADIENKPTEFPPADHNQPWSTITDTPDDYPPEDHKHDIEDVNGLQDALDNAGGSYAVAIADTPPENGKSGDTWFDSTEGEGALYIHDGNAWFSSNNSGSGAGIEDAPEDGVQYSRQDGSWSAVDAYDDSQISSDLSKEIQDRETGDAALQNQIDQLGSGGGGGVSVGATSDGSALLCPVSGNSDIWYNRAIDYSEIDAIASGEKALIGVDSSQLPNRQPEGNQVRRMHSFLWSQYWKKFFCMASPINFSSNEEDDVVLSSPDGVNWMEMGSVKDMVNWSSVQNVKADSRRNMDSGSGVMCIDDSCGRLWFAGTGTSSGTTPKYQMYLGWWDLQTNEGGLTKAGVGSDNGGNKNSYVIDWKWIPDLQQIIILYTSEGGTWCTGLIEAGSKSFSSIQDKNKGGAISTGQTRNEDKHQLLHSKVGDVHKFFVQGDADKMWTQEGTSFGKFGSSSTSSQGSFDNRHSVMNDKYQIRIAAGNDKTTIYYIRTDNDDWKTDSAPFSTHIINGVSMGAVGYDPVMDNFIGVDKFGSVLVSETGTDDWVSVGITGKHIGSSRRDRVVRRTSGKTSDRSGG